MAAVFLMTEGSLPAISSGEGRGEGVFLRWQAASAPNEAASTSSAVASEDVNRGPSPIRWIVVRWLDGKVNFLSEARTVLSRNGFRFTYREMTRLGTGVFSGRTMKDNGDEIERQLFIF